MRFLGVKVTVGEGDSRELSDEPFVEYAHTR
jgi:hypothetical protein